MSPARRLRTDAAWTGLALLAVLVWDLSAGDLALSRHLADAGGFPWRNAWITRDLLHEGGRWLSGLLLLALVIDALRAAPPRIDALGRPDRPGRAERGAALVVVVMGLLLVPLLKRASATSCPWDLSEFGGRADGVSHWQLGALFGGAQVLRGAHFVSHVLWSGWICWALAAASSALSAWSAGAATTIPAWRRP